MGCEGWQEAISALVDGETPDADPALVEAHLRRCPSCRAWRDRCEQLRRHSRLRAAGPAPDLAEPVSRAIAVADRGSVWAVARLGLVVVAAQIVFLSLPELLGSPDGHGARHLGSFSIAYAIALLVVAVRPARAATVLPVSFVLVAALAITAVADAARGSVAWLGEVSHVPELLSLLLLWMLAHRLAPRRGGARQPLRLVDDDTGGRGERTA